MSLIEGTKVKIISKSRLETLRRNQDDDNDCEGARINSDMIEYGGKITTICSYEGDDEYMLDIDGEENYRSPNLFTVIPDKQPSLLKKGNCICGAKKVPLINIQDTYICSKCVSKLFKSYKLTTGKKL